MKFRDIDQRISKEIERMFPGVENKCIRWEQLKVFKHHLLVSVTRYRGDDLVNEIHFLALDTSDGCLHLGSNLEKTTTDGLLILLKKEGLGIERRNCEEIIELFDLMHHQKLVFKEIKDLLQWTKKKRKAEIEKFIDQVKVFSFEEEEGCSTITFLATDFWTGNLEQWHILENAQGEICIESKVLKTDFVPVL